jgi:hypothetical protein
VEFFFANKENESKVWADRAAAEEDMNAYVKSPNQLTDQGHQISKFFYYSMRGAPNFDSGLLEAEKLPEGFKTALPTNAERPIYRIFKQKTPGG